MPTASILKLRQLFVNLFLILLSFSAFSQNYNSDTAVYKRFELTKSTEFGESITYPVCGNPPGVWDITWSGVDYIPNVYGRTLSVEFEVGPYDSTHFISNQAIEFFYKMGASQSTCPDTFLIGTLGYSNIGTTIDYHFIDNAENKTLRLPLNVNFDYFDTIGFTILGWNYGQYRLTTNSVSGVFYGQDCSPSSSCSSFFSGMPGDRAPWFAINYIEIDTNGSLIYPDIRLFGKGQNIIHQDSTPSVADHTDFDTTQLYGPAIFKSFYIKNQGTDTLKLIGNEPIEFVGVSSCDFYLPFGISDSIILPGDSLKVKIAFAPSQAGLSEATVLIYSNDYSRHPFKFSIQGVANGTSSIQYNSPNRVFRQFEYDKYFWSRTRVYDPMCVDSVGNPTWENFGWEGTDWVAPVNCTVYKITAETPAISWLNWNSAVLAIVEESCKNCCFDSPHVGSAPAFNCNEFVIGDALGASTQFAQEHAFSVNVSMNAGDTLGILNWDSPGYWTSTNNSQSGIAYNQCCNGSVECWTGWGGPWVRIDYLEFDSSCSLTFPDISVMSNNIIITHEDSIPNKNDNTSFGNTNVNSSINKHFSVKNNGTDSLYFYGEQVYIEGLDTAHFSITSQPVDSVVLPGDSTSFTIAFEPKSVGLKQIRVKIKSNDFSRWPFEFAIEGTGVYPSGDTAWIWVDGDSTVNQTGSYGQKGVTASSNLPVARARSTGTLDDNDVFWLFGGESPSLQSLNDLWSWDGMEWTWVSGDSVVNQTGVYGSKGIPSSGNKPGSRIDAVSWTGPNGNFWLFGGLGYDASGSNGYLNDLWKWDGSNWTWVSGNNFKNQAGDYGTKGTSSSSNVPGARYRAQGWVDSQGNLWLFGGQGYDDNGSFGYLNDLWKWDGTNWTWVSGSNGLNQKGNYGQLNVSSSSNVPGARTRAAVVNDDLGNGYMFGGNGRDGNGQNGNLNDLWRWDGTNWTWIAGDTIRNQSSVYGQKGTNSQTNKIGSRFGSKMWFDANQNIWLFGGFGIDSIGTNGHLNDLWRWDTNSWTWVSGSPLEDQSGTYGIQGVADTSNVPGGRYSSVSWQDSTGGLWLFSGKGFGAVNNAGGNLNDVWRLGIGTENDTTPCNLTTNLISLDTLISCSSNAVFTIDSGYVRYLWSTGDTTRSVMVESVGELIIEVEDNNGCTGWDTVFVSLNESQISVQEQNICQGESTNLQLVAFPNSVFTRSYLWSTGDSSQSISVSPNVTSTYWATVTDGYGVCSDSITIYVNPIDSTSEVINACNTYTWPLNGQVYTNSGTYYATLADSDGCDSVVTLDLSIHQSDTLNQVVTACSSYTWPVNNQTYSTSGVYTTSLINQNGCDSIIVLDLTIKNSYFFSQNASGCDAYMWPISGQTYTASGTYLAVFQAANGCDSTYSLTLVLGSSSNSAQTASACNSYTWPLNGQVYSNSGTYTATLQNSQGCDSVVSLNLTIHESDTVLQTEAACNSYFWPVNNQTYTSSGTYFAGFTNNQGCDSVVALNLYINNGTPVTQTDTACDSYFWSATGIAYSSSGVYSTTLTDTSGCSFTATLNLTIKNSSSGSETITSCNSYQWPANGQLYTASGNYTATLPNYVGCDSIVTLSLTINSSDTVVDQRSACGTYTWPVNNQTYSQSGLYYASLTNTNNCDSTVVLDLTVNPTYSFVQNAAGCDSYVWPVNSQTYLTSGTYQANFATQSGCDSVYTLNLTINQSNSSYVQQTSCSSYTWSLNGQTYSQSGDYQVVLTNAMGCDSIVTLNLIINESDTTTQVVAACNAYTWPVNNQTYTTSGQYTELLSNSNNCDSIVQLNLTINTGDTVNQNANACDQYIWPVNGQVYTSSGIYTEALQKINGCDSIVNLNLVVNNSNADTIQASACNDYTWPVNNQVYTQSGYYSETLLNSSGCDSVLTLDLAINKSISAPQVVTSCNTYTWPVNGQTYTFSTMDSVTLSNQFGCDSVLVLDLTIYTPFYASYTDTACDSYIWAINNQTYTSSGSYAAPYTSSNGCDSIYVLQLTIKNSTSSTQTQSACVSYTWPLNGQTYTTSGNYNEGFVNSIGCDSTVTLNLTIHEPDSTIQNEMACNSFVWGANNQTYTSTGQYLHTFQNQYGCDSLVWLNLIIHNSDTVSQQITECERYLWPVNGQEYTSSGVYYSAQQNQYSCDSIVTLDLTILPATSGSETTSHCNSFTWNVNGNTYNQSGVYIDTIPNQFGCDSVVTLNLTINESDSSTVYVTACNTYTWPLNNQTYTSSGLDYVTLTNSNNCDSVITLDLTIITSGTLNQTVTECDNYTWPVNNTMYSSSGVYTATVTDSNNCTIQATLNLTINSSTSSNQVESACNSYTWPLNGNTYYTSGVFTTVLNNSSGCDSTVTLNLTINDPDTTVQTTSACDSFTWPVTNQTYTTSGVYTVVLNNVNGCDSLVSLELTINSGATVTQNITACDTYTWPINGQTYTQGGAYSANYTNQNGCDSNYVLNLSLNQSGSSSSVAVACNSYYWSVSDQFYSTSGQYTDTLQNSAGCDSVVTLNLTVNASDTVQENVTACNNYTWPANNQTYTASGNYTATLTNTHGCDSTVHLNLTINNNYVTSTNVTSCGSYYWPLSNQTYVSSGSYLHTINNPNGCDTIVTLNLTIKATSSFSQNITACDSYFWNVTGQTYTSSGIYSDTITSSNGCDSINTLNLFLNQSDLINQFASACDSFYWPLTNQLYTTSGNYNYQLTNAQGCDSTIVLNLTINTTKTSTEYVTACDSYTWPINNQTYTTNGIFKDTINSSAGCDSIVFLVLTLNNSNGSSIADTGCGNYFWYGTYYFQSGTYTHTVTNSNGCDSVLTLNLTILQSAVSTQPQNTTVNIGDPATFNLSAIGTGIQYQWQTDLGFGFTNLSNAGQYSGVNTNSLTISNTSMSNNNQLFRCIVASSICGDTSDVVTLTVNDDFGVDDEGILKYVKIYPNPANQKITMEVHKELIGERFKIIDNRGVEVYSGRIQQEQNEIDIEFLSAGQYHVELKGETISFVKRK